MICERGDAGNIVYADSLSAKVLSTLTRIDKNKHLFLLLYPIRKIEFEED